jgi:hypothetical protein
MWQLTICFLVSGINVDVAMYKAVSKCLFVIHALNSYSFHFIKEKVYSEVISGPKTESIFQRDLIDYYILICLTVQKINILHRNVFLSQFFIFLQNNQFQLRCWQPLCEYMPVVMPCIGSMEHKWAMTSNLLVTPHINISH